MTWFETYRQRRRRAKRAVKNRLATVNERPVLVLGHQKSGTTAIAALLARHAGLEAARDLRWQPPLTLVDEYSDRELVDQLVRRHRIEFSRGVVKDPEFTFLYAPLRERFPQARFVMIVRDPRDTIRSLLNRLEIPGDRAEIDLSQYAELNAEWQKIMKSAYLGIDGDHYVERLAARWNRAADVYLKHESDMHLIRYEDFCTDKPGAVADLAQRLGLPQRRDIAGEVDRQYQPRGDRNVSWETFFGEHNLMRVERLCDEQMKEFGYVL